MFSRARWRLTLWFAGALVLILAATGAAVFLTARTVLFDQVDDDLEARVDQLLRTLSSSPVRSGPPQITREIIGPLITAGGYSYALTGQAGTIIDTTPNVDTEGL